MRVNIVLVGLIALAFVVGTTGHASGGDNDAGSGVDAGGLVEQALALSSTGLYAGNLSAFDTSDWYEHDAPSSTEPTCVTAKHSTEYGLTYRLASVALDQAYEITTSASGRTVGVATPGYTGHLLELSGPSSLTPLRPYSFQSSVVTIPADLGARNDGLSGADASMNNLVPLKACTVGALQPSGYDGVDLYTFSGTAGKQVTLSMASQTGAGTLTLRDPNFAVLATSAAGQLMTVTLPSTGTYYTSMSSGGTGLLPYVIGMCDPQCTPPTNPCRPSCIDLVRES